VWALDRATDDVDDVPALQRKIDYVETLNNARITEKFHFDFSKEMEVDKILYPADLKEALREYDQIQKYLDSQNYQYEDVLAACRVTSIEFRGEHTPQN
ncbi:MAG: hypothetical protein Q9169_008760, partial [Polycauliona sp. 2 TL-2023]